MSEQFMTFITGMAVGALIFTMIAACIYERDLDKLANSICLEKVPNSSGGSFNSQTQEVECKSAKEKIKYDGIYIKVLED